MRSQRSVIAFSSLPALFSLGLLSAAFAVPVASSIPFGPHGRPSTGSISAPVPLTPDSFLCAASGPDLSFNSNDDVVLFVRLGGMGPVVTPLSTPRLPTGSGRIVRLSATRALAITAGPDGSFSTPDDTVLLLDELGTGNTVTPLAVGPIDDDDGHIPSALTASSAVLGTDGADQTSDTADDSIALLEDLGTANTITFLPAPRLRDDRGRPTVLTPTSCLVPSDGPDALENTADDQVYLFTGLGTTNTRTDLSVPRQFTLRPRLPVRITDTRAVIASTGLDATESTADDALVLLDQLGSANTITPIPLPHLHDFGSGAAAPLSSTMLVVATEGPDSNQETLDDQMAVVTGLGTTNTVTLVTVGGLDEDLSSRAVRLSPTRVAVATGGSSVPSLSNLDDEVVIISGVGTTNTLTRVGIPGLSRRAASAILPLSSSALAVSHGGANGQLETGLDDAVSLVEGIGAMVSVSSVGADAEFRENTIGCAVHGLGGGRAVALSSGPDGNFAAGGDDVMRLVEQLPQTRALLVAKYSVKINNSPGKIESFSVSGRYRTDDAQLLVGSPLTVSVGNSAQTIPANRFKLKSNGQLQYADGKRLFGFITKLTLDPVKGTFSITGKGLDAGVPGAPDYVPVAVEGAHTYLSDVVAATPTNKGFKFP